VWITPKSVPLTDSKRNRGAEASEIKKHKRGGLKKRLFMKRDEKFGGGKKHRLQTPAPPSGTKPKKGLVGGEKLMSSATCAYSKTNESYVLNSAFNFETHRHEM